MKASLLLALSFTVAFAQVVSAEDSDEVRAPKNRAQARQVVQRAPRQVAQPRSAFSQAPRYQRNFTPQRQQLPQVNRDAARINAEARARFRSNVDRDEAAPIRRFPNTDLATRARVRPTVVNTPPAETAAIVQTRTDTRNRDWRTRNGNGTWHDGNSGNWADGHHRHNREHHHRDWWRSRFNRFVLFGGGYYYWDNNYWYPAYGYDPYYNSYSYDEPIYGYDGLAPGQVIANVQSALQEEGYYRYAVDGLMGPGTRAAIANYQRDHGLPMTAAIDQRTLQALGLS